MVPRSRPTRDRRPARRAGRADRSQSRRRPGLRAHILRAAQSAAHHRAVAKARRASPQRNRDPRLRPLERADLSLYDVDYLNPQLEPFYSDIVAAIRGVDPNHAVLLEGAQWGTNFAVFGRRSTRTPSTPTTNLWINPMRDGLQSYLDFSNRWNVPVFIGETGEFNNSWNDKFHRLQERFGLGWCFWPYKNLDSDLSVVSIRKPPGWDLIADAGSSGSASLPTPEQARAILHAYLEAAKFPNVRVNVDYITRSASPCHSRRRSCICPTKAFSSSLSSIIAGWSAGRVMEGGGFGLIGDLIGRPDRRLHRRLAVAATGHSSRRRHRCPDHQRFHRRGRAPADPAAGRRGLSRTLAQALVILLTPRRAATPTRVWVSGFDG